MLIDDRLFRYCKRRDYRYTRYADDLTFSGNKMDVRHLIPYIEQAIWTKQFKLNEDKTEVLGRGRSQRVTGIVVNERLRTKREYRRKIRQEIYYIRRYGLKQHMEKIKTLLSPKTYVNHLRGQVNYILYVDKDDREAKYYKRYLYDLWREIMMGDEFMME